jgi:hypothetical protein
MRYSQLCPAICYCLCRLTLLQAFYSTQRLSPINCPPEFQTTLYLPSNSGVKEPVVGAVESNSKAAKNSAALASLVRLMEVGKLDGHLQPVWKSNRLARQLGERSGVGFTHCWRGVGFTHGWKGVGFTHGWRGVGFTHGWRGIGFTHC